MNTSHLSNREQEEYLLNQRTPQVLRHLAGCPACGAAVAALEQTLRDYRALAVDYSAQTLAARPQPRLTLAAVRRPTLDLRWAFAVLVPLVLLALALLPLHLAAPRPVQPVPALSDDALLDQVDEQLSVAVPSPMESLTHLVSAGGAPGAARSKPSAQNN